MLDRESLDLEESLVRLYRSTVADVHGFVLVRCGDRQLAEDVTSEVYAAAARAMAVDRSVPNRPWLFTVARRRLIDRWRATDTAHRGLVALANEACRAESVAATESMRVRQVLDTLSTRQRMALTLRYLDELSVAEVADAMGQSYSATESLLARGKRSFRKAWEPND